jgi:hypothetical protein
MALANSRCDSPVTFISNSDDAGVRPNRSELGDALLLRVHDSPGISGRASTGSGTSFLWAQKRTKKGAMTGVRWSSGGIRITQATSTRCSRCNKIRPEVCFLSIVQRIRANFALLAHLREHITAAFATNVF